MCEGGGVIVEDRKGGVRRGEQLRKKEKMDKKKEATDRRNERDDRQIKELKRSTGGNEGGGLKEVKAEEKTDR